MEVDDQRFVLLCSLDAFRSCGLESLDTSSLLRLSEANRALHGGVTAELFRPDVCVHCGSIFAALDNRVGACLPIRQKAHRAHRGERVASERERRRRRALVEMRHRIARGDTFAVEADRFRDCDRCGKRYLGYRVADDAWEAHVPSGERDASLCMACFLAGGEADDRRGRADLWVVAVLVALAAAALELERRGLLSPRYFVGRL